jgi:hypothetical protein
MRIVIGAYHSLVAAQRAARALELQMSIQNLVVRDQRGGGSRTVEPEGDGQTDERPHADFVLSMSGTAQHIEQARALLRAQSNVT